MTKRLRTWIEGLVRCPTLDVLCLGSWPVTVDSGKHQSTALKEAFLEDARTERTDGGRRDGSKGVNDDLALDGLDGVNNHSHTSRVQTFEGLSSREREMSMVVNKSDGRWT